MNELVHLYDVVIEDNNAESKTNHRAVDGRSSDAHKKDHEAGDSSHDGVELPAVSSAAAAGERREGAACSTAEEEPREGAITCNSTEMIREKQRCTSGEKNSLIVFK